jgi:hypothetical protein
MFSIRLAMQANTEIGHPDAGVTVLAATMPVPVIRKQPLGMWFPGKESNSTGLDCASWPLRRDSGSGTFYLNRDRSARARPAWLVFGLTVLFGFLTG